MPRWAECNVPACPHSALALNPRARAHAVSRARAGARLTTTGRPRPTSAPHPPHERSVMNEVNLGPTMAQLAGITLVPDPPFDPDHVTPGALDRRVLAQTRLWVDAQAIAHRVE